MNCDPPDPASHFKRVVINRNARKLGDTLGWRPS
jgi:hypothetical protein